MYQLAKQQIKRLLNVDPLLNKRSPEWPNFRKKWLRDHYKCEVCGGSSFLEVHHIIPFHLNPSLELNENNLITLCDSGSFGINCHLFVGHCGSFRKINPNVKENSVYLRKMIEQYNTTMIFKS